MSDGSEMEALQAALPKLSRMNSILRFDLNDGTGHAIDARGVEVILVEAGSLEPDCPIKVCRNNLVKLVNGAMEPILA